MAEENLGLDLASQTGQENIKNAIDGLRTEGLANQEGQEAISSAVGLVASQLATALRGIVLKTTNASIGTLTVTENGTYDTNDDADYDAYEEVIVDVPNSYETTDEGKVVSNGSLVSQSSQNISANGTYDTTEKNEVVVSVLNSYETTDEGKVISSGELVAQTSRNVTENGTYDTTLNNEVIVNVPNNGATLAEKTITQNGTYNASDDNVDGYSQVVVNVESGGVGDVVINENEIKSVSEGSFSFSKSTTITKNGQYKITAFSYADNLNVTVNGVTQSLDFEAAKNYVRAYSKTIALNAGDIVTVSSSGTGKCLASVVVVDLDGNNSDNNNVLYNPAFNINTTGQTSWDASNSGTSSGSRTHTVDAWDIMQATAEDVSGGIKIVPKKSYAYLTQQIPYWFAGKSVKITAVVNDIEYTVTGICPSSGTGVSLNTPFGQLYIYAYTYSDIVFTLSFTNQVDSIFVVKETSLQIAA